MSNKEFSEFAVGGDQKSGDLLVGLRSGVNTKFNPSLNNSVSFTNNLVVASNGNDTTGNGSFSTPYLTLAKVSAIAAANPATLYRCIDYRTQATESSFTPQPNVQYFANNCVLTLSSASLGSGWGSASQTTNVEGYIFNTAATCLFDFSSFSAAFKFKINFNNCGGVGGGTFSFKGFTVNDVGGSHTPYITINYFDAVQNNLFSTASFNFIFSEGIFNSIDNSSINDITVLLSTNANTLCRERLNDCKIFGTINLTATSTVGVSTPGINYYAYTTYLNNPININANQTASYYIFLGMDSTSWREPTITGSGLTQNISLCTSEGIVFPYYNTSFVSALAGEDFPGYGSFGRPYATIAYAMSQISSASATVPFSVILLENKYTETNSIAIPASVSLIALNPDCIIANSLPIVLGVDFVDGPHRNYISNITIGGSVDIDYSSATSGASCFFKFDNLSIAGSLSLRGNTNGLMVVRLESCQVIGNASIYADIIVNGYNNVFYSPFLLGTLSLNTAPLNYNSFNDTFSTIIVTTNAAEVFHNSLYLRGAVIPNGATDADGPESRIYFDVDSWVPVTLSNGAPLPSLLNVANGLASNVSPINFSPTDESVSGSLAGLDTKLATTAKALLVGPTTPSQPFSALTLTDGQLPIGSTGNSPVAAALIGGVGIIVTIAPGSITVSSSAGVVSEPSYLYGFNATNGITAKTVEVPSNTAMAAMSADSSFLIVGTNTTYTLDITASGVNGLDTGSAINGMRYFLFIIADSTAANGNALLASLSLTPALPAGYNKFRCIGSIKTKNASTDIVEFYYRGVGPTRTFVYTSAKTECFALSAGHATSLTALDLWPIVSDLCYNGQFNALYVPFAVFNSFYITQWNNTNIIRQFNALTAFGQWYQFGFDTGSLARHISYKVDAFGDSLSLYVSEFDEQL